MLDSEKMSLRMMESFPVSAKFIQFAKIESITNKYNSIRDHICSINSVFFERLQEEIFCIYNKELQEKKVLSKTDSTYISIAARLISRNAKRTKKQKWVKKTDTIQHQFERQYLSTVKVFTDHYHKRQ